ncbi:transmembrane protein, putative (macronuclear) [Tetrahymena thermophila SB210]|uniref:Transmembrane protein, putative n=1 Tax=Tetrahymena thermophila (strain SB210) TaxID=312017 RepID=I7MIE4_TETTS|nr:transmembrane protein, putative [Tetrahymena thermophila SB210]EAS04313.2 transmembrane protein, putative [Tetrahymena thermophila SB210]|eukprot:XP_001024558.2 transmembrane protein, putative [Tetrahymena thermophila SB210]
MSTNTFKNSNKSLFERFNAVIKHMDLFGQEVKMNYRKTPVYTTCFGGVMTIITFTLILIFFSKNVQDFIQKKNIQVLSETTYLKDPPLLELNFTSYMFAVQIQQENFLNKPYFLVQVEQKKYQRKDGNLDKSYAQTIQMEPCRLDHWKQLNDGFNWEFAFNKLGLDQWLCPKKDQKITLEGNYASSLFQFMKISILKCENKVLQQLYKWDISCASEQEFSDFLKKKKGTAVLQIYQSNNIINPQQEPPNQPYLSDDLFFYIHPNRFLSSANIYLQEANILTDQSIWPNQNYQNQVFPYFEQNDYREAFEAVNPTRFGSYFLRRGHIIEKHNRQYQKIDSLLSYIGGFLQFVIFVMTFIVGYFNYWIFVVDIANRLYNFKKKEDKQTIQQRQEQLNSLLKQNENNQNIGNNLHQQNNKGLKVQDKQNELKLGKMKSSLKKYELSAEDIRLLIKERQKSQCKNDTNIKLNSKKTKKKVTYFKSKTLALQNEEQIIELEKQNKSQFDFKKDNSSELGQKNFLNNQIINNKSTSFDVIDLKGLSEVNQQNLNIKTPQFNKNRKIQKKEYKYQQSIIQQQNENFNLLASYNSIALNEDNNLASSQRQKNNIIILDEIQQNQQGSLKSIQNFKIEDNQDILTPNNKLQEPLKSSLKENQTLEKNSNQYFKDGIFEGLNISNKKSFLINQFEQIISKNKRLIIGIKFFLNKIFCGCLFKSIDNKLINKAHKLIQSDLDVYMIIQKLQEIDKIKQIIFDKQQQIMFGFFPKIDITVDDDNENEINYQREYLYQEFKKSSRSTLQTNNQSKETSQKSAHLTQNQKNSVKIQGAIMKRDNFKNLEAYKKLYEAYCYISKQNSSLHKHEINQKLINMLGSEMADIFQTSKLLTNEEDIQSEMEFDELKEKGYPTLKRKCLSGETFKDVIIFDNYQEQFFSENDIQKGQLQFYLDKLNQKSKLDKQSQFSCIDVPQEQAGIFQVKVNHNNFLKDNAKINFW